MTQRRLHISLTRLTFLCVVVFLLGCQATHEHSQSHDTLPQYQYIRHENPMEKVDASLQVAKQTDKNVIVVLGAQWCHDSRGLAEKFSTDAMQTILNQHFETVFIDVGFLEDRRDITQRFSQPTYFGTPTVLVVDPQSESLLNMDNILKWLSADSVAIEEYVADFSMMAKKRAEHVSQEVLPDSPITQQLNDFAQSQAQRLVLANGKLGPLLKNYKEGQDNSKFDKMWTEIRTFRVSLLKDLIRLHNEAKVKIANKDDSLLKLPHYKPFEWESI